MCPSIVIGLRLDPLPITLSVEQMTLLVTDPPLLSRTPPTSRVIMAELQTGLGSMMRPPEGFPCDTLSILFLPSYIGNDFVHGFRYFGH